MASPPTEGLLDVTLRTANFAQAGSWDMVAISKLAVELPIGMLRRFAASRIQPYTVLTAEAMGSTFCMSWQGRKNVENALEKLPAAQVVCTGLEIGFGVEDIIKTMAKGEGGVTILALCAALRECFADDVAVEILLEYARATKATGSWLPSNMEWRSLLDTCAGSLSNSNFSLHAETLMSICGKGHRLGSTADPHCDVSPSMMRGCSAPRSIATALRHLADLTNGKILAITLCGGPDIGWVAAVAEWLLSLRVAIFAEDTDELSYKNFDDNEECQVRILYRRTQHEPATTAAPIASDAQAARVVTRPLNKKPKFALSLQSVNVKDTTRLLNFEDATKMFQLDTSNANSHVVSGRVEWQHALRSTFLADFEKLMEIGSTFGMLLGSAARLSQAIANADTAVDKHTLYNWTNYCDASHGVGFVDTATKWFPELSTLRKSILTGLRLSVTDAVAKFESCVSTLRGHCGCKNCATDAMRFTDDGQNHDSEPSDSENDGGFDYDPNRFCAVVIAEVVIYLCHLLSNVQLHCESLTPTRSGIELAYDRLQSGRKFHDHTSTLYQELGLSVFWIHNELSFAQGESPRDQNGVEHRLSAVLELFTGRIAPVTPSTGCQVSAIWTNGITAYIRLLKDDNCDDRNDTSSICLIPGRIFYEGKSYTRLSDTAQQHLSRQVNHVESRVQPIYTIGDVFRRDGLLVKEAATDLRCLINTVTETFDRLPVITPFGPSALAWFLACRRGIIKCKYRSRKKCHKVSVRALWINGQTGQNHVQLQKDGKIARFWQPASSQHFAAIVSSFLAPVTVLSAYIIDRECQDCCLQHALTDDVPFKKSFNFIYVAGTRSVGEILS